MILGYKYVMGEIVSLCFLSMTISLFHLSVSSSYSFVILSLSFLQFSRILIDQSQLACLETNEDISMQRHAILRIDASTSEHSMVLCCVPLVKRFWKESYIFLAMVTNWRLYVMVGYLMGLRLHLFVWRLIFKSDPL